MAPPRNKSFKPPVIKARVRNLAAQGLSHSKIAQRVQICRTTVKTILNEPDVKEAVEQSLFRFKLLLEDAVDAYQKKIKKGDIKLATRVLINEGILKPDSLYEDIPPAAETRQNPFVAQQTNILTNPDRTQQAPSRSESIFASLLQQMTHQAVDHQITLEGQIHKNGNGQNGHKKKEPDVIMSLDEEMDVLKKEH